MVIGLARWNLECIMAHGDMCAVGDFIAVLLE